MDVAGDALALLLTGADQVREQRPALGKISFELGLLLALGHVADASGHDPTLVGIDRTQRDVDRKLASVLAQPEQLKADAHRPRPRIDEVPASVSHVLVSKTRGEQHF